MEKSMKNEKNEKWYDSGQLVDFLCFLFPPIGFFALYKSKKIIAKPVKIMLSSFLFIATIVLVIALIKK